MEKVGGGIGQDSITEVTHLNIQPTSSFSSVGEIKHMCNGELKITEKVGRTALRLRSTMREAAGIVNLWL